ncbi:hypothetical protein ABZ667_39490 [Streptomyces lavendulae]|uniref:hypothetical protein n=1 Tax=Streptomyces lavendulae TaxID=1914 RepID=UPI0034063056
MDQVRQFGEKNDYPVLPWPGFDHHPELVAEAHRAPGDRLHRRRATPLPGPRPGSHRCMA